MLPTTQRKDIAGKGTIFSPAVSFSYLISSAPGTIIPHSVAVCFPKYDR